MQIYNLRQVTIPQKIDKFIKDDISDFPVIEEDMTDASCP